MPYTAQQITEMTTEITQLTLLVANGTTVSGEYRRWEELLALRENNWVEPVPDRDALLSEVRCEFECIREEIGYDEHEDTWVDIDSAFKPYLMRITVDNLKNKMWPDSPNYDEDDDRPEHWTWDIVKEAMMEKIQDEIDWGNLDADIKEELEELKDSLKNL